MYDYLTRFPWIPEGTVQITPVGLLPTMFFSFSQSAFAQHATGYTWGWHEYGAFIGPVAAILALIAVCIHFKRTWRYLVLILISLILVLGSFFPPFSPWDLLHKLPGFESIRVPSRFALLAVLCIALLAGRGVDVLQRLFKYQKAALGAVLFGIVLATHLLVCLPILSEAFTRRPTEPPRHADFKQIEGDPNRLYAAFLANRGTLRSAWLSAYRPGRGILDYNNQTNEWYSEGNAVRVVRRGFSPNRLVFDLDSKSGGTLLISQGYDTGWRRADGGEIKSVSELIAFDVKPEDKRIEISYYPDYFTAGAVVSSLSVLLAIFGPFIFRRRHS